jgi:hypothetical protein
LNRKEIIQKLIDHRGFTTYLEIGVFLGSVFFAVKAKFKLAVDPNVKFSRFKFLKRSFKYKNPSNLTARSMKLTSDDFFAKKAASVFKDRPLDICLVDGMHEYSFALRDVENALRYLQKDGVIIMHDCNPATKEAAMDFESWKERGFADEWNGDVWKAVLHLRSQRSDINVFVLDTDYGLGVISFGKPDDRLDLSPEQIRELTYEQFDQNRKAWLNLKPPSHFYEYFNIKKTLPDDVAGNGT